MSDDDPSHVNYPDDLDTGPENAFYPGTRVGEERLTKLSERGPAPHRRPLATANAWDIAMGDSSAIRRKSSGRVQGDHRE